jgi:hypothetical protein
MPKVLSNLRPSAVVITDSERLRPSSPLPDVGQVDSKIPILLVRVEDQESISYFKNIQQQRRLRLKKVNQEKFINFKF